jgi:hypothetical protein
MLTGESKPVLKVKGDKVIAGSINGNGSLKVTVSHAAKDSYLTPACHKPARYSYIFIMLLLNKISKMKKLKKALLISRSAIIVTKGALVLRLQRLIALGQLPSIRECFNIIKKNKL